MKENEKKGKWEAKKRKFARFLDDMRKRNKFSYHESNSLLKLKKKVIKQNCFLIFLSTCCFLLTQQEKKNPWFLDAIFFSFVFDF